MSFGVDRCWFLWSLSGNVVLWLSSGSWVLVWVGGGGLWFWFGSARWVCFGLSKGFVGRDGRWPAIARSQSGRARRHGYGFLKKIVDLGLFGFGFGFVMGLGFVLKCVWSGYVWGLMLDDCLFGLICVWLSYWSFVEFETLWLAWAWHRESFWREEERAKRKGWEDWG